MKQLPFRYEESLEKDLAEVMKLQHWGQKKNKALVHAVKIASAYIRKQSKGIKSKDDYQSRNDLRNKVSADLDIKDGFY